MNFNLYEGIKSFHKDTYSLLMRDEALNLIPLGNIIIGKESKDKIGWRDPTAWFMATVTDDPEFYRYHINKKMLYILEHEDTPVSMAQKTGYKPICDSMVTKSEAQEPFTFLASSRPRSSSTANSASVG